MQVTAETGSYNERRYGKPWIAKVDFSSSKKGDFIFGDWIGQSGASGLLEIEVEPGDIIARGQKDFRRPRNSAPDFYIVESGGTLKETTKPDAYKHWKASQATPERQKLEQERERLKAELRAIEERLRALDPAADAVQTVQQA